MDRLADALGFAPLDQLGMLLRLLLAAVLGGVVGIERERRGKPAGFRTNLLICVGAALITDISFMVAASPAGRSAQLADPGRIAAQIVSGVGFLGAGTIIQARGGVRGLTTAATLWVVAAIGMAVGSRAYIEAVSATVLVIVALFVLGRLELRMREPSRRTVVIEMGREPAALSRLHESFAAAGIDAEQQEVSLSPNLLTASFRCRADRRELDALVQRLLEQPGVRRLSLR